MSLSPTIQDGTDSCEDRQLLPTLMSYYTVTLEILESNSSFLRPYYCLVSSRIATFSLI